MTAPDDSPLADAVVESLLEVGVITRPHGVRGEVKVRLHWPDSDALGLVDRVLGRWGDGRERWLDLVGVRRSNRELLVRVAGVTDRDQAEELRGCALLVERASLPPLAAGEYYLVDLVGARVECGGSVVGTVVAVRPYDTVDVVVIRTSEGKQFEQPLLEPWVVNVDAPGRRVELSTLDGLI